jgi:hypothetical protein
MGAPRIAVQGGGGEIETAEMFAGPLAERACGSQREVDEFAHDSGFGFALGGGAGPQGFALGRAETDGERFQSCGKTGGCTIACETFWVGRCMVSWGGRSARGG